MYIEFTSFFHCLARNVTAVQQYLQQVLCRLIYELRFKIACAILQETLHKHNKDAVDDSVETVEESLAGTDNEENEGDGCLKLFTNWPLMSSITLYCIFSVQDVAYAEVKLQLVC